VPCSPVNVKDIYKKGGNLNDVWANPFFAEFRNGQEGDMQSKSNWRTPCLNRDHQGALSPLFAKHEPVQIGESALEALPAPDEVKGVENNGELHEE